MLNPRIPPRLPAFASKFPFILRRDGDSRLPYEEGMKNPTKMSNVRLAYTEGFLDDSFGCHGSLITCSLKADSDSGREVVEGLVVGSLLRFPALPTCGVVRGLIKAKRRCKCRTGQ